MIVLLVITDGRRDCIEQTLASAEENLSGPIDRRIIYDDSGEAENRDWLRERFGDRYIVTHHPDGRQGFGGAIRFMWQRLTDAPERFVFHLEDDFTFNRPVDLEAMATVLDCCPDLVQLALRRQPWNDRESAAGGVVECYPDAYEEIVDHAHRRWLEHRLFFTTNPSLYRRSLCDAGWPNTAHSEGVFTHQLLTDPAVRFGFWGARSSGEWVTHIGHQRVGSGY